MANLHYNRILIKLSGEVLSGKHQFGIDYLVVSDLAKQIKNIHAEHIQIGIVIGGGNIFRGISSEEEGMDRVSGDYIGMMATIMNSVALQNELEDSIQNELTKAKVFEGNNLFHKKLFHIFGYH